MTAIFDQLAAFGLSLPVAVGALVFFAVFLILFSLVQVDQRRRAIRRRAVAYNPASEAPLGPIDPDAEKLFAIEQALSQRRRDRLSKLRAEMVRAGFSTRMRSRTTWAHDFFSASVSDWRRQLP